MRIIRGHYKGKKLNSPTSDHIRPTSDRMRESIFNILEHGDGPALPESKILDLFAGSGALGIEALSRGAAFVTFVDNDRTSLDLVKQNLKIINSPQNISLKCINSLHFQDSTNQYDIIFIDPPYKKGLIIPALINIHVHDLLADNGIIIVESAAEEKIEFPDYFNITKTRKMGKSIVNILTKSVKLSL